MSGDNILNHLKNIGISFELHEHEAVFTVEEAHKVRIDTDFGENKNLFLRNRKGDIHYLVTIAAEKQLDLKQLAELLGEKSVGFASPERLKKYLDVAPGSVSPFGLINDVDHVVRYVIDSDLLQYERLGFHPNTNTQTVVLSIEAFQAFLDSLGNQVLITDL